MKAKQLIERLLIEDVFLNSARRRRRSKEAKTQKPSKKAKK